MAPVRRALVCALAVLLLTPQAAAAGGWWSYIDVNRTTVAAGQRVEVTEEGLSFRSIAAEKAAESGQFYVYLLRDFDYSIVERAMRKPSPGNWWSVGGAEAIQIAQVTVSVSDANLGRADAAFTVPELPPATYHLMLCDAGCSEPLADVIPAEGFTVVADQATAQIAQRVERLERRIRTHAAELEAVRAGADSAQVAIRNARSEVEQLEARLSSLVEEVRTSPRVTWWAYAGWLVAGALVGLLVMLVHRRRVSRRPRRTRVADWRPSDEELRELLSSESGRSR
jgi:hypothetical protein